MRKKYPSDDVDKLLIRFPKGMRDRISEIAQQNRRSMNSQVIVMLERVIYDPLQMNKGDAA